MDIRSSITPVIAIVGRANVGKSTLFNRLIEQKKAITSPLPGTTRDINFGHCHWRGIYFTVVDTAGLDLSAAKALDADVERQAALAIKKANAIIFLANLPDGLLMQDRALAKTLRSSKKTVILAGNKADNPRVRALADDPEWQKLGFGRPLPVSAANGSGIGDLLDVLVSEIKKIYPETPPLPKIDARIAIIGRPNVGKSSLLNALAGEERVIVSEVPHTTKEPQDTLLAVNLPDGEIKNVLVIDTVGIRKKARIAPGIEKIGVAMSLEEMKRADVALLLIDAAEGVGVQERKLAGLIEEAMIGAMIVVNKWDLAAQRGLGTAAEYRRYVLAHLPFFVWAPIEFISAKTGRRSRTLIERALAVAAGRERMLVSEELDPFVEKLKKMHHAAFAKAAMRPKVYGITQIGVRPPTFMVVVQKKEILHPNFLRYVERRLREEFGFEGTPIRVMAREISR